MIQPPASTVLPRPRLAIPLGDPAGIGPEVILKALADPEITQGCEITLVGSRKLLIKTYVELRSQHPELLLMEPETWPILDVELESGEAIQLGVETASTGAESFAYLNAAISQALAGTVEGIVTGPIAKSAWKAAGHEYAGQTELLAERAGVTRFGMLFVARSPHTGWMLRTLLATTHIPLGQVPKVLTPALMTAKLELLLDCLRDDFGLTTPRIAIAGLNPHSGERGQLGHEEQEWLLPWLTQAQAHYPHSQLEGLIPPDTLWVKPGLAWYGSGAELQKPSSPLTHDAYLALYHDQGLIPVKLMAFDRAVNTTIGLPFVRTSPDHGTAFDIAGQGKANAASMKAAIQLAAQLVYQRRQSMKS